VLPATPSTLPSSAADGLSDLRPAGNPGRPIRRRLQSSAEYFGDSSATSERFPRGTSRDRTPTRPTSADTIARRASASAAVPDDGAGSESIATCSPSENSCQDFRCDFTARNRV
jgi:hypothetical protein